jgi:7-cyano-7-deazaguanine synthase
VALGLLRGNPFGDASEHFLRTMGRCLTEAFGRPLQVLAPLRRLSKTRLIRSAPTVPWRLTFSCLRPRGRAHCGACNKCAERRRALRAARLDDPTIYALRNV